MKHPHLKGHYWLPWGHYSLAVLFNDGHFLPCVLLASGSSYFSLLLPCHCLLKVTSDYAIATPFGDSYLSSFHMILHHFSRTDLFLCNFHIHMEESSSTPCLFLYFLTANYFVLLLTPTTHSPYQIQILSFP